MKYIRLGTYLAEKGLLNKKQIQNILNEQGSPKGIHTRFGRIAIRKGFITQSILRKNIFKKFMEEQLFENYASLN